MLAVVQCNSAQEVRDQYLATHRRILADRIPRVSTGNFDALMAELSAVKAERDLYLSLLEKRQDQPPQQFVAPTQLIKGKITVDHIIRTVCAYYSISRADLLSKRRTMKVVVPRQIAMFLAKELTIKSLPDIGRIFADRDHTTVLHAVRRIPKLRDRDSKLDIDVRKLLEALK